jgi:D-glycero-D-manno-heptose 1,7-bisphosphate phosphatase
LIFAQLHGWRPPQRDVEAGIAAGSRTIFIDRAYREPPPMQYDHRVSSTLEALTIIESESEHEKS